MHNSKERLADEREQVFNLAIDQIFSENKPIFAGCEANPDDFIFGRFWSSRYIRQMGHGNQLIDLPGDVEIFRGEYLRVRGRGSKFAAMDLIKLGETLIPLGTHFIKNPNLLNVYHINEAGKINTEPIYKYLSNSLPNQVVLTRTLSKAEAEKYTKDPKDLGSSYPPFWYDTIHTCIHNVTNEFKEDGYEKLIKFLFDNDQLLSLAENSDIEYGTYSYAFFRRDKNSPFPFDLEIKFKREAFEKLIEGYRRWVEENGARFLKNPYYLT
ncbi:MAG: hypothetical protein UX13_C0022G0018 [Candidatus Woesebacteria bacterium GW2011_GWB1_45_5]|uniref:Uncharacterized protein n=1 Tax=Candidatus Woesebacteria bacterium GW2011_GWB1_45_5 TaxID=1618581 RepID=A0A0G1MPK7_9BACT|nr:MAG: hypothetical protein UX13_C0022G0018 [Candidatus Woesebacteria bacterium GW2011_GWB1_45_5]